MAPGKTAPRLLQDLLTYDPRHEERAGRNLLTSPPPQYDGKGPNTPAVPARNCRHKLFTKTEQSQLPLAGEDPGPEPIYKVASYCTKCRWHVDVTVDHTKDGSEHKPCGKGNKDYALHHFCYSREDDSDGANGLNAPLRPRTYTFYCSAPACPVTVVISFKPPCFSDSDIETMTNQAQLRRRWEAAKQLAGDRADAAMARRVDAPDYLNTYLQDSLNPAKGKARIPLLNKKFLKTFGRDCDSILQRLGFESKQEADSDGAMSPVWYLPKPEEPTCLDTTVRDKIEDARYELNTIILDMPENEREGCRQTPMYPTPSQSHIERTLACADYAKVTGREARNTAEEDHPYYAGLGALGDFDDALILFAYSRQSAVDIANSAYYFECLQDLATGRQSEMLGTQVAVLASNGVMSKRDIDRAYQYFGIDPAHAGVISDEHIIGGFKARLSDISPLQAEEARKQLRVLGDARHSDRIRAEASDSIETYEQAMAWFDLETNAVDDFVTTMYSIKTQDNPTSLETAQKALSIIAEKRRSEPLRNFLKFGTVTEPEMDLGDAYALLNVPDRSVATNLEVLDSALMAAMETGNRQKYEKAYALILKDQAERFNNRPENSSLQEKRNNYPLDTWPVGLRNIGNTCYLNSVLQFLFTIKPLRDLILNCEEYMQDPSPEALKGKIVGRTAVSVDRVLTAQKFVRELRSLYERMITAPTYRAEPRIDLASLALCKTDNPVEALKSPAMGATPGASLGLIDGAVVSGPMLPPPSSDAKSAVPENPATTSGDKDPSAPADSVMGGGNVEPITSADSVMNDDGGALADGSATTAAGDVKDVPAEPTRPPPIPPRPAQQADQKPATESKSKIHTIEESARQQDAAEVMGNIFDLISCAIKGEEILRENEQGDIVKKIFASDIMTVLEGAEGIKKVPEYRNPISVLTGERDRSLYAILDDDLGLKDQEDNKGTRYDYVEKVAPVQIMNVKRALFNKAKNEAYYDYSHVGLDTTIYMDRYMSETATLDQAQLLEQRRAQWAKRKELRELHEKRKKLQTTDIEGMALPDCLEATSDFIQDLRAEKEQGSDSLPTPPPELSDALHDRAKHLLKELEAIDPQIAQLEAEIDTFFRDCHSLPYRLHAVFIHRGDIKGGHYWIYIHDFQNNIWRRYNDEIVDEVDESEVLAKHEGNRPGVSTGMVYIRADLVNAMTEAVCRRPDPASVEEATAVEETGVQDVLMRDVWEEDSDVMPALEDPMQMEHVPIIEGVEKE